MLLGSLGAGALAVSAPAAEPRVTPERYFTNDVQIPGAGYYHAPFHGFYPHPYNHYDTQRRMYFYGGQWATEPHRSIVNISTPTEDAARQAEKLRTDSPPPSLIPVAAAAAASRAGGSNYYTTPRDNIPRSGFGSSSGSRSAPS